MYEGAARVNFIFAEKYKKSEMLYRAFLFLAPSFLTKSQAHYKFLYLENFRGGQFKLYRAWDLVKFRGGQKKKHPVF